MRAALRYELVRISTVPSTLIAAILALVLPAGLAWLIATPSDQYDETGTIVGTAPVEWYAAFAFPLTLTAVIASVVASQAIGQEYRFGVIRLTLSAFPRRWIIVVAKLVVVVAMSVALALLSLAGCWLALVLRGHPTPSPELPDPGQGFFVRGVLFLVLWALSAFALAGLTRLTAIGIAVPVVSGLIVENIVGAVLANRAEWLVDVLPWSTASRWWLNANETMDPSFMPSHGWAALGIFLVWVVALLVTQAVTFANRDA